MTVSTALTIYMTQHAPSTADPKRIGYAVEALLPFWGDRPLTAIKGLTCRQYAKKRAERPKLSRGNDIAKAMDYVLKRWPSFTRFLDDGRVCLSNNSVKQFRRTILLNDSAERALRGIALGRKSWLFAGSDRGGRRAAIWTR